MEVSKCHSDMQPSSQMPRGAVSAASLYVPNNRFDYDFTTFSEHLQVNSVTSAIQLSCNIQTPSATLGGRVTLLPGVRDGSLAVPLMRSG